MNVSSGRPRYFRIAFIFLTVLAITCTVFAVDKRQPWPANETGLAGNRLAFSAPPAAKVPAFLVPTLVATDVTEIKSQVVAADFNGDGRIDLAVETARSLQILMGRGDGSFISFKRYPLTGENYALATGNLNNDGLPDLVVSNSYAGCARCEIQVLLGNGNGTFRAGEAIKNGAVAAIAIADLNNDGNGDIVLALTNQHNGNGVIGVLLGNGDGSFANEVTYAANNNSDSVVINDFNQDNKPDIVYANGDGVHILYGNGNGTFQNQVPLSKTVGLQVSMADFNSDGLPDLITQNKTGLTVLLNKGQGNFTPLSSNSSGLAGNFTLGDFNNDGRIDVAISGLGVMFGKGDGTFTVPAPLYSDGNSGFLIATDVNRDNKMDLVQVTALGLLLFFGNGSGSLRAPRAYSTAGTSPLLLAGDFNGDKKADVVAFNSNDGSTSLLRGNGNGTFQTPLQGPLIPIAIALAGADVDHDGNLDIIAFGGSIGGDNLYICLGNGDGTFLSPITVNAGIIQTVAMAVADFNHDGKPDIAVVSNCGDEHCSSGKISILIGNGDGSFQTPVLYAIPSPGNSIVAADFDGDGVPDLATANGGPNPTIALFLNNGDGSFQPANTISTGINPANIVAADFNGDGKQDLAFTQNQSTIQVMLGTGAGSFGLPISTAARATNLIAADFNGDGKADLAGYYFSQNVSVYTSVGDGTFLTPINFLYGSTISAIVPAWLGNNTFSDILTGTSLTNSLAVVVNATR